MNDYQRLREIEEKIISYFKSIGWDIRRNEGEYFSAYRPEEDNEEAGIDAYLIDLTELAKVILEN